MGVGGELLAERVADAGLDVVGIEANLVGGERTFRSPPRRSSLATGTASGDPAASRARDGRVLDQPRGGGDGGGAGVARRPRRRCRRPRRRCRRPRARPGLRPVRFGGEVLERSDGLLPPEEPEAGALIAGVFGREGIDVRTGVGARSVARVADGVEVELEDGPPLRAERLLVATGRRMDLAPLGVASVGIDERAHSVPVDDRLRAADRLWAIGDVTGLGPFTHIAVYQARIAAADILGEDTPPADYHALPRVTFTDPEVGAVGLTERRARDGGHRRARRDGGLADFRPRADPQGRQRRLLQAHRGHGGAACSSARHPSVRTAARRWGCSPWRCTPRCRSKSCGR